MGTEHGVPGEWARVRGTVASLWPLFASFALLGAFTAALALERTALFAGLLVAAGVAVMACWRLGARRVEAFFVGARGEERVAGLLRQLPSGCHVFHDFVAGAHHVDHVVAMPGGLFCVETKSWRGKVTVGDGRLLVNGRLPDRDPTAQAARQADAVRARLRKIGWHGDVAPLVCFASDTFEPGEMKVSGVPVVNANRLVAHLVALPAAMSPDELARLTALMETC